MIPNEYTAKVLSLRPYVYLPLDGSNADASRNQHSTTTGGSQVFNHSPLVAGMKKAFRGGQDWGGGWLEPETNLERWLPGTEDKPFTVQGWVRLGDDDFSSIAWHTSESDGIGHTGSSGEFWARLKFSDNSYNQISVYPEFRSETIFYTWIYDGASHTLCINDWEPVTQEVTDAQKALGFKGPADHTVRFADLNDKQIVQAVALYRKALTIEDHQELYLLGRDVEGWPQGNTFGIHGERRYVSNQYQFNSDFEWNAGFKTNVDTEDGYLKAVFDENGESTVGEWIGFVPVQQIDSYVDTYAFWESEGTVAFSVSTNLGNTWTPLTKGRRLIPTGLTLTDPIAIKIEFVAGETTPQRVDYFKALFYGNATVNTDRGDLTYSDEISQAPETWKTIDGHPLDGSTLYGDAYMKKTNSGGDYEWEATELVIHIPDDLTNRHYYDERNTGADNKPYISRAAGNVGFYWGTDHYLNGEVPGDVANLDVEPGDYVHLLFTKTAEDSEVAVNDYTDVGFETGDLHVTVLNHYDEAPDANKASHMFQARFGRPSVGPTDSGAITYSSDTGGIDTRDWTALGS